MNLYHTTRTTFDLLEIPHPPHIFFSIDLNYLPQLLGFRLS
jgi:hypothetical protein